MDTATNCVITKSFLLELTPPPVANNPGDISLCETNPGANTADFDISFQTAKVLGGQSTTIYDVTYHINAADANAATNPIDPSIIRTSGIATVFVRVQNRTDFTCFNTTSFNLIVIPRPTLDLIPDQFVCIGYVLPALVNPGNYYSGTNKGLPMLHAGDVITTDSNIFIYNETGGTPSCSNERSFHVEIVIPADIKPADIIACDKYILPTLGFGTRYFTLPGGPAGGGTELFGGASITTPGTTVIYTYFVSTDITPCELQDKYNITINLTPTIAPIPNAFDCLSYNLPPLAVGNYYTYNAVTGIYTPASSPITTTTTLHVFATNNTCRTPDTLFTVYIDKVGLVDITQCQPYDLPPAPVGEYRDAPNGGGNIIPPGLISQTTKVYIYVPGAGTPNCTDNDFFTITINAPSITTPVDITTCASYLLPVQVDGADYYTLPGGPATPGNAKLIPNVDTITTTTTIYVYKQSAIVAGCFNEKPWLITINQKPVIDSRADVEQCNSYVLSPLANGNYFDDPNGVNPLAAGTTISKNDRIYIYAANPNDPSCYTQNFFDISINGVEADPIPTQLTYCGSFTFPPLPTSNNFYYDAPGGPLGGGNKIPAGTTVTPATVLPTYYIYYETGDRLNCSDENPFSITIVPRPIANPVNPLVDCDTFGANDGISQFDLTTLAIRNQVLNGQAPDANFTLTFFTSLAAANDINTVAIVNPAAYQNDNPFTDSIWIRASNNTIPNSCFAVVELKLIVNPLPNIQLDTEYFICEDYATGTLLNPATLNTGLSASNYIFEWTLDGNTFGGNTASITTSQIGDYIVKATNTNTNCINTVATKVSKYEPYLEITYSDAFENPSYISVNVLGVGSGNYEYQIDDSLFQDSNRFDNIAPGEHILSVRDKNGYCNPAPIKAVIINYPKYFTPNGDGFHDTWNIVHLIPTNPNAPIFIFDRYGKLIKEISPSSSGWNGTYNGEPLPSTDYWFRVDYSEKGTSKTFKSHFSLKR
jgi:gliding motility-associated-like protein